jgi:hypothetical protein
VVFLLHATDRRTKVPYLNMLYICISQYLSCRANYMPRAKMLQHKYVCGFGYQFITWILKDVCASRDGLTAMTLLIYSCRIIDISKRSTRCT